MQVPDFPIAPIAIGTGNLAAAEHTYPILVHTYEYRAISYSAIGA
jgi:hypothetical protein